MLNRSTVSEDKMYGRTERAQSDSKEIKVEQGGVAADELDRSTTTRVTEDTYFIPSHAACLTWETKLTRDMVVPPWDGRHWLGLLARLSRRHPGRDMGVQHADTDLNNATGVTLDCYRVT